MRRLLVAFLCVVLLSSSALAIDQLDATTPTDSGLISTYGASLRETRATLNEVITALTITGGTGAQYYLPYWSTATALGKLASKGTAGSILTSAGSAAPPAWTTYLLSGTAAQTYTFPTTSATIARTDAAQTFTGTQTFSGTVSGAAFTGAGVDDSWSNIQSTGGSATKVPSTNALMDLVGYAPTREIWIAPRTDGIAGDGTIDNPFDASTAVKLQALLGTTLAATGIIYDAQYGYHTTVHFMPGTYHTTTGIPIWDGYKYVGSGMTNTIIEYDGNTTTYGVISNYYFATDSHSNMTVSDMTVDCNSVPGSSWDCAGVNLRGKSNLLIERVRSTAHSGTNNEADGLVILTLSTHNGYNNAIRDCIVDGANGAQAFGIGIGGNNVDGYSSYSGSIENNRVYGPINIAYGLNHQTGGRIVGNYADNATVGLISDTGNSTQLTISNNYFSTNFWAMVIGGGYKFDSYNIHDNVLINAGEGIRFNGNVTNSVVSHNKSTGIAPLWFDGTGNANNTFIDNIIDSGVTDLSATDASVVYHRSVDGTTRQNGVLSAKSGVVTDSDNHTLTSTELYGGFIEMTGVGTVIVNDAAVTGMNFCVFSTEANIVKVRPKSTDSIILKTGTDLGAGVAAKTDASVGAMGCFIGSATPSKLRQVSGSSWATE